MENDLDRSKSRRFRLAALLALFGLLAGAACNLTTPNPTQPTPFNPSQTAPSINTVPPSTAVPTAIPSPQPTHVPQNLPAAVVETTPLPNSEISLKQPIIVYFNQPMEKGSVEAAWKPEPAVAGSFKWLNDYTVSFTPDQPLPKDTPVTMTLSTQARAANGLPLAAEVDLPYRTAAGFQATTRLPQPDVNNVDPRAAVVVTFDHPIVALGDTSQAPAAFSLEPSAQGRGEWLNTSTYIFYPEPGLSGGKKYTVHLNQSLTDPEGLTWATTPVPDWSFTTVKPALLTVAPDHLDSLPLDASFVLTFNVGMDPDSFVQNFSFTGPDNQPVNGKITWNSQGTEMTFTPQALLQRGQVYIVVLSGKAQARGGTTLGDDISWRLVTVPDMAVIGTDLAGGSTLNLTNGFGNFQVSFTSFVPNNTDLTKYFTIDPAVANYSVNGMYNGTGVFISGIFSGRTNYTLTVGSGMPDQWGQTLKEDYVLKFKTSALPPSLTANIVDGMDNTVFLTPAETSIPAQATNIKTLNFGYAAISVADFAAAAEISPYERLQKFVSPNLATFSKKPGLPADKSASYALPLTPDGKGLTPGLYYYVVTSPDLTQPGQTPGPMLLVVSKVQLTMKVSATGVTVWAVDLDSDQPVAGAKITIYDDNKGSLTALGDITTDASGLGTLGIPNRSDADTALYAVTGKPGDPGFSLAISSWSSGSSSYDFGYPSRLYDNQPLAYLYTDRPIYRPGQTVDYRVILRQDNNGRYTISGTNKLNLQVYGDYDSRTGAQPLITTVPVNLSDFGAASGSFILPATAAPGYYHMDLAELSSTYLGFQVADYRKPEIDLSVQFSSSEQLAKQAVNGTVKAAYYFGAPGAALDFDWTLTSRTDYFEIPGNYQTGKFDPTAFMPAWYAADFGFNNFIASGSGTTNADGTAAISVAQDVMAKAFKGNIQDLQLEVTLRNQGDFPVSARTTMRLHPANTYIGVKPDAWSGQANQQSGFSVLTVDWQGKPAGNVALKASFQQVTWNQTPGWTAFSNQSPYTLSYNEVASTNFTTDGQGAARIAFTPPSAGTYLVDVGQGDADSQVFFWVGGEGSPVWPALPNQEIRLSADNTEYQAGQTAHIFFPNPLGDNALALVTEERSKVMQASVVQVSGSSYSLDLPVSEDFAPNVYVSVTLIGKNDQGQPDFRIGYLMLNVKPAAETLNVELTSLPQKVQPSGDMKFGIKVTDSQGQPAQGEFSLAVVDKAVLALADPNSSDITTAFYGTQQLGVLSSLSLGADASRLSPLLPGGRGGGGGGLSAPPSVRQNFADTAYWNGTIRTDANGAADVTVKLPDNLTTWVITLRGLTKDTQVGEAVKEVVATKDLLIRPITPSFLVAGDHIQLAAMVHNNTTNVLDVNVALQAAGVDLDDPSQATQKVNVAANSLARLTWWVKVQDTVKVDLQFSASSGNLQDASTPETGSLPVDTYSTSQSYGTSGILAQAGEQLEVVSVPRSFTPTGGSLQVEMSPSLAGTILEGLKAMDSFPDDFTEPVLSRLVPNLETLILLQKSGIDNPDLKNQLNQDVQDGLESIQTTQNKDGGWGWAEGHDSDPYLTAYALYGLSRAASAGFTVDQDILAKGIQYTAGSLVAPTNKMPGGQLDSLAFQVYALQVAGAGVKNAGGLYGVVQHLSPWARAMLALTLEMQNKNDPHIKEIVSDLESTAIRSATGAYWETPTDSVMNYASANFTSSVVLMALAHFDPASSLVADAVRYLVSHRLNSGCWSSSYETAWALVALGEELQGTGDLQGNFAFSATLNDAVMLKGQAGGAGSLTPVAASVPLSSLDLTAPNALKLIHEDGDGRLYYRAFLQVDRPVETVEAMQHGISIERAYYLASQDCQASACQPVTEVSLGTSNPTLLVRLTVTVPHDMNSVVVEDFIPAGAEIVNLTLKTAQQVQPDQQQAAPQYNPANPFLDGWGSWYFSAPVIYDDHIRWAAATLPAGTYQLTYRLTPLQAGEFHLIPAHAYQYYFPDMEGSTDGVIFKITP